MIKSCTAKTEELEDRDIMETKEGENVQRRVRKTRGFIRGVTGVREMVTLARGQRVTDGVKCWIGRHSGFFTVSTAESRKESEVKEHSGRALMFFPREK